MAMKIYILEDDRERRDAMRVVLTDRFYQYEVRFFIAAQEMIDELQTGLADALLISLDHDLEPDASAAGDWHDPGDGRLVADFLAQRTPVCPVVIHTTNSPAAVGMESALRESGWSTHRVKPYSDLQWINEAWFPTVRRAIVDAVGAPAPSAEHTS